MRQSMACCAAVCLAAFVAVGAQEKKADEWKALFDGKSLDGWKQSEFGNGGDVAVEEGKIVIDLADGCNGITWQKEFPKNNYEVSVEAMRVEGSDFFCGITFPVEESPCSLIIGGWGGGVVGLSNIDGEDAAHNDTTTYAKFEKGRWYTVRLRVTKDSITAWVDDKQLVDQPLEGKKLSIRPEVAVSKPFGIASWRTTAAIRNVKVRQVAEAKKDK